MPLANSDAGASVPDKPTISADPNWDGPSAAQQWSPQSPQVSDWDEIEVLASDHAEPPRRSPDTAESTYNLWDD
jgi:hypothetical protein